jgi:hypothetical protein
VNFMKKVQKIKEVKTEEVISGNDIYFTKVIKLYMNTAYKGMRSLIHI